MYDKTDEKTDETNTKDERRLMTVACKKCSLDKRKSVDRKCSFGERKYTKENQERLNAVESETDSQIYRSLFGNKSEMDKKDRKSDRTSNNKDDHKIDQKSGQQTSDQIKCKCRGCADYMRSLKT